VAHQARPSRGGQSLPGGTAWLFVFANLLSAYTLIPHWPYTHLILRHVVLLRHGHTMRKYSWMSVKPYRETLNAHAKVLLETAKKEATARAKAERSAALNRRGLIDKSATSSSKL